MELKNKRRLTNTGRYFCEMAGCDKTAVFVARDEYGEKRYHCDGHYEEVVRDDYDPLDKPFLEISGRDEDVAALRRLEDWDAGESEDMEDVGLRFAMRRAINHFGAVVKR